LLQILTLSSLPFLSWEQRRSGGFGWQALLRERGDPSEGKLLSLEIGLQFLQVVLINYEVLIFLSMYRVVIGIKHWEYELFGFTCLGRLLAYG